MKKRTEIIDQFDYKCHKNNICYNFKTDNLLKSGKGVQRAKFTYSGIERVLNTPKNVTKILGLTNFSLYNPTADQTVHRMAMYGDDKILYFHQMYSGTFNFLNMYKLTFENTPIAFSYRYNDVDAAIFASKDNMVVWKTNTTPYKIENAPIVTSMCVNEGVLFATILSPGYKIWYNKNLNLEQVGSQNDTSGYISLDDDFGYARKVITFDEFVYVFRDYGISKISNYKGEIVVSEVYKSNTLILSNTISACGNVIVFLTTDGIYTFNGIKVSKSDININSLIASLNNAVSSSLGENYYLALKLNFDDGKQILCEQNECVNNAILIINVVDFSFQIIRGIDVLNFNPLKVQDVEKMLVIFNTGDVDTFGEITNISTYNDEVLPKYWCKENLFADNSSKLITKFSIKCSAGVDVVLSADNAKLNFKTQKDGINEYCFKRKCKNLKLEILSSLNAVSAERVEIEYYVC